MGDRLRPVWAAVLCAVSFTGVWAIQRATHVTLVDVTVYRAAGWTVRRGGDLYAMRATPDRLPMTYPPFAGLLFVPLTWLGAGTVRAAAIPANLLLTVPLAALSLRLAGRRPRAATVLVVAALVVWTEPVWSTLRHAQVNLLLTVLVLWDLTRRPGRRSAGVGIGLAAGIKLTPALFVVLLAAAAVAARGRGQPYLRTARVAAGTFAATVAVPALVLPRDSLDYWTGVAFAADRPGFAENVANQSLRGVLARGEHSGEPGAAWLCLALAVGVAGLAIALAALFAGDRLPYSTAWAAVACGVTALLISPVSWTHHWVWDVPMLVLLASEAGRRGDPRWAGAAAAAALAFSSFPMWALPHGPGRLELHENAAQLLVSAAYPLTGLAFLALAATVAIRSLRRPPPLARRPPSGERPASVAGSMG